MPHSVRMPKQNTQVIRSAFAIFMEPNFEVELSIPKGQSLENVYTREDANHKLSPLEDRWRPGMNFGDYFENCKQAFHTKWLELLFDLTLIYFSIARSSSTD